MKKINIILATFALLGVLALMFSMPTCGQNGMHIGWSPQSDCPSASLIMALEHISDMYKMQSGTVVSLVIVSFLITLWFIYKLNLLNIIRPQKCSTKILDQGENSYFYLMKPFDDLLFILTKIHKRHFAIQL